MEIWSMWTCLLRPLKRPYYNCKKKVHRSAGAQKKGGKKAKILPGTKKKQEKKQAKKLNRSPEALHEHRFN
jgi:hypothetical protein